MNDKDGGPLARTNKTKDHLILFRSLIRPTIMRYVSVLQIDLKKKCFARLMKRLQASHKTSKWSKLEETEYF